MAIDFQDLQHQIHTLGEGAPQRESELQELRAQALRVLEAHAGNLEGLRKKVARAASQVSSLRCARPEDELLTTHLPSPDIPAEAVVIAADGSQIAPDRHLPVDYYLINVGVIEMRLGADQPPETTISSQLHYGDDLFTAGGFISEGLVTLKRDLAERRALADHTPAGSPTTITLTDGPLELWGAKEGEGVGGKAFREALQQHLSALSRLCERGAATAGYVDKPRADLVVRLLEIALLDDERLDRAGAERPLRGVTDWDLFHGRLAPGERSAVFGLQSQSVNDYKGVLALHFFYLNVGRPQSPWLARVEAPRWVVSDPLKLGALHAVIVQQCRALGARPYPYLLHRAHETAVVSLQEKEQLTQMIVLELQRRGVRVGDFSQKQAAKGLAGRTRYSG
jgi:hypothetical protein